MIDCTQAVRQLWDYIERELDTLDQAQMEEHLTFCRRCCGEVAFAEEIRDVMKRAAEPNIPEEVSERLGRYLKELENSSS